MSDPQDLLYTNQFLSTNILSDNDLKKQSEYYDRFSEYINNETKNDIEKYVENDNYETSDINIDRTLNKKWPVNDKKNHYPLFDSYINDISVNRYKKEIITKVNIDSRNRDLTKYLYPNNFSLEFPQTFNNVKKFEINDIIFPNVLSAITNYDNNLAWQYPSQNFIVNNNIDFKIIPVPDNKREISFSNIPNAVYGYTVTSGSENIPTLDNYLLYQIQIPPGNYNITNLIKNIKYFTSVITHGKNLSDTNTNIIEQPYLAYPNRIGTPHLFEMNINPQTNIVKFVNRIEEINILAIQTFSPYENNFPQNDMFYYYSSQYTNTLSYTLDKSYIYIILPSISDITYQYYLNINCIYTPNPFPLIITNLTFNVGGIDNNLINFTPFFDETIYTNNGYVENEIDSISHYKFIDTITFKINNNTKKYLRFGLKLSSGNIGGKVYDSNGKTIKPCISENIILSPSLKKIVDYYNNSVIPDSFKADFVSSTTTSDPGSINGIINNNITTTGLLADYEYKNANILIGRALLFRWIFDKNNGLYVQYEIDTLNCKKRSLLHNLAWPIANETQHIYTLDLNYGFSFVQTNINPVIVSEQSNIYTNLLYINNYPQLSLNLQRYGDEFYFVKNSYIYLKLKFNTTSLSNDNSQIINAVSSQVLQYNQIYVQDIFFNVGIGEDFNCIENSQNIEQLRKDQYDIFAKILLSNNPGNTDTALSNIINNNSFNILYNSVLDNISNVSIEVFDDNLKLLSLNKNFSFTLNIHEVKDILKETLVNTKTNNVITTGNFI